MNDTGGTVSGLGRPVTAGTGQQAVTGDAAIGGGAGG
jgi:hypothetical protein